MQRENLSELGILFEKLEKNTIQCVACAHRCVIKSGKSGICKIRYNKEGVLYVPKNYVAALQVDPIEKKPFFHVLPGSEALSFGMLGCDFHCEFCQNWQISQAFRDPRAEREPQKMTVMSMLQLAEQYRTATIVSTYNEPLITSEWAVDIFTAAHHQGYKTGYVSNGFSTPEVLDYLQPHIDFYKVDLKTFQESEYKALGGKLEPVLTTIKELVKRKIWVEVVTLVIPDINDSREELVQIAEFLKSVDKSIPWHVTAYHPDYKMFNHGSTPPSKLIEAVEIGKEMGLDYVYAGNRPGMVKDYESTYCPNCGELLVKRNAYNVSSVHIVDGKCPACGLQIPGIWH